jgi:hypothetical protein
MTSRPFPVSSPLEAGLVTILVALSLILIARYRLTHPDWRERGWWSNHPWLALWFGGRTRRSDRLICWVELGGGVLFIAFGVFVMIHGFKSS